MRRVYLARRAGRSAGERHDRRADRPRPARAHAHGGHPSRQARAHAYRVLERYRRRGAARVPPRDRPHAPDPRALPAHPPSAGRRYRSTGAARATAWRSRARRCTQPSSAWSIRRAARRMHLALAAAARSQAPARRAAQAGPVEVISPAGPRRAHVQALVTTRAPWRRRTLRRSVVPQPRAGLAEAGPRHHGASISIAPRESPARRMRRSPARAEPCARCARRTACRCCSPTRTAARSASRTPAGAAWRRA